MQKILHILSQIPAQTGSGIFLSNLIRQCARAGYEQAAVLGLPVAMKGYHIPGISGEHIYEVLFETEQLPFKIPGMSDVMPYESSIFSKMDPQVFELYRSSFKTIIAQAVSRFRPDVVLSNHLWVATAAAQEAVEEATFETAPPKLFAVCHGTDIRQMHLSPDMGPYVRARCRKTAGIFSLNTQQAQTINRVYEVQPEKIHVTGTGYDSAVFYREPSEKEQRNKKTELVYAGKLARSKGLYELIQSMELLDAERYRLTIAGKGSGPESDEILVAAARAQADIRYIGQLAQKDLAKLFRRSDIFILPSYYEGLPLVVLEALASGLAVIVNDLDGLRDWLGEIINASGRVSYVPMPKLKGIDTCAPEAGELYIRKLASAILTFDAAKDGRENTVGDYYTAIEERSWVNVFMRMERLLRP